jgi:hypothetical protein
MNEKRIRREIERINNMIDIVQSTPDADGPKTLLMLGFYYHRLDQLLGDLDALPPNPADDDDADI